MGEQTEATKVPGSEPAGVQRPKRPIGGVILIVIGALLLADNLWPSFSAMQYWPLILVGIGIAVLWRSR